MCEQTFLIAVIPAVSKISRRPSFRHALNIKKLPVPFRYGGSSLIDL